MISLNPQSDPMRKVLLLPFCFPQKKRRKVLWARVGQGRGPCPTLSARTPRRATVLCLFWFSLWRVHLAFLLVDSSGHLLIQKYLFEGQFCVTPCWALLGHTSCGILSANYRSQPPFLCWHSSQSPGAVSSVACIRHIAWHSERSGQMLSSSFW